MVSSGGYVASFSVETWGFHTTEREEETSPTNRADLITIVDLRFKDAQVVVGYQGETQLY